MIAWPDKKYSRRMLNSPNTATDEDVGWNACLKACIAAEKSGRMSVEEIRAIIRKDISKVIKHNNYTSIIEYAEYGEQRLTEAIHEALYGGSQHEEKGSK